MEVPRLATGSQRGGVSPIMSSERNPRTYEQPMNPPEPLRS
jgi:hypothetical protein